MIFSLIVIVLALGIVYFHFVQGLLSGIISMVLAILAGSLAVGMHEWVVANILGGKMADSANGMMLCVIFAAIYGIGRILFDSLIPGNVRLPLYVDSLGGMACGIVVAIFATGTFAVAAQSLPFGPAVLYHSRYPLAEDKEVTVNGARRQESAMIVGAVEIPGDKNTPDPASEVGLMFGTDSMVVDFAAFQSESGALAGGTKLRDRHPNLLRELFLQRGGMEPGAKHTAMNIGPRNDVAVAKIFALTQPLTQMDGENPSLRRGRNLPKAVKMDPSKVAIVVRINVTKAGTDTDSNFRFSTGSIRLLSNGKDLTPVGVLYEPGRSNLLMNYRADDFLVAKLDDAAGNVTVDLVFIESREDVLAEPAATSDLKFKPGAFLEVKRLARVDLSDKDVALRMPDAAPSGMLYKKEAKEMAENGGEPKKS